MPVAGGQAQLQTFSNFPGHRAQGGGVSAQLPGPLPPPAISSTRSALLLILTRGYSFIDF